MSLGQNANAYRTRGSDVGVFRLSDSAGSYTGALMEFPIIKESNYEKVVNETTANTESGTVLKRTQSKEFTFSGTFLQTDVDTLNLADDYEAQYLCIVKEFSRDTIGGQATYVAAPASRVKGDFSVNMPTGEVPFTFNPEVVNTAVTLDLSKFNNSKFQAALTGNVVIPAGQAMVFFDVAI